MKRIDTIKGFKTLEKEELLKINGGDKFTYDLGYLVGKITRFFKELSELDWSGNPLGYM